ncbi:Malectin domain-containing protein [Hirschfeldia incana]|nr:Malectin domain-containing protein [Hirschfeldia incana]
MHAQAVKKVLRYLKGTIDFGIWYSGEGTGELDVYTDSDFAGDVDSRKSTSGVLTSQNLTGLLPREFSELRYLKILILSRNCLTGSIPEEWASMELEELYFPGNRLSGSFPEVLTRITSLRTLDLEGNRFSGPVPPEIGKLVYLAELSLSSNSFTGPLPEQFGLLKNLIYLEMFGSGLDGPLPSSISSVTSLIELELRACNIIGQLPKYIGDMTGLKTLDLSFNLLTGKIPPSIANLKLADYMYKDFPCYVQDFPCLLPKRKYKYKLYINCGGGQVKVDKDKTYEANVQGQRSSTFVYGPDKHWAFSCTGHFMNELSEVDDYTVFNTSRLSLSASSPDLMLYKTARVSPLVLTYYGLCLGNGHYTVSLHFTEIIFTSDNTFYSLGRRVFNIYLQEKLMIKDFNIKEAAGGSGKPIIKTFQAHVTKHNLKISLRWAGKGTTSLPISGVYGPMISAISVEPNFKPPVHHDKKDIPIVVAVIVVLLALVIFLWKRRRNKKAMDRELEGLDLQTGTFTFRHIKAATNNFGASNKIGEGGFGPVYKGVLSEGRMIAVKKCLQSQSKEAEKKKQLILVYEYLENNCLSRALFGKDEGSRIKLEWPTRKKICLDIARGLTFLHEESVIKIVHRDIKTSNVLLDENLNAKISDFGFAKLNDDENTHISTRIAGTAGYMAPEYAMHGYLTNKADVYSFGVVAIEIVSGKSNSDVKHIDNLDFLVDQVPGVEAKNVAGGGLIEEKTTIQNLSVPLKLKDVRKYIWQSEEASTSGPPRTADNVDVEENTPKDEIVEEPYFDCD